MPWANIRLRISVRALSSITKKFHSSHTASYMIPELTHHTHTHTHTLMHDCRDKQNHAALQFMADDLGLLGGCFSSIEPTPVRICTLLTSLSFPASSKYSSRPLSGPDAALGWVCMSVVTMCVWSDNNLRTK